MPSVAHPGNQTHGSSLSRTMRLWASHNPLPAMAPPRNRTHCSPLSRTTRLWTSYTPMPTVAHAWNRTHGSLHDHLFTDPFLIEILVFSFPIGYTAPHHPAPYQGNHPSATQHPQDVAAYITKELQHSAILGPFTSHPFDWPHSNPIMTRPKKDSSARRVIVDLSMPHGCSVNSGIPKTSLNSTPFKPKIPNPATLTQEILKYGIGCLLYKVDPSRAYRQLWSDPLDWPFLMLHWED